MLGYLFVAVYMLSVPLETTGGEVIKTLGQSWQEQFAKVAQPDIADNEIFDGGPPPKTGNLCVPIRLRMAISSVH